MYPQRERRSRWHCTVGSTCTQGTSYCRCVKSEYTSDGKRKGSGNRRNGNPYLSWAFSEVAHHAARWSPRAKRFYERKCAQTHKIVANRALANKMARASYYIIRDQVSFDAARAFGRFRRPEREPGKVLVKPTCLGGSLRSHRSSVDDAPAS